MQPSTSRSMCLVSPGAGTRQLALQRETVAYRAWPPENSSACREKGGEGPCKAPQHHGIAPTLPACLLLPPGCFVVMTLGNGGSLAELHHKLTQVCWLGGGC